MELFLGIVGCIAFAFLMIGFQALVMALLSDTDSKMYSMSVERRVF